MKSLKNIIKAVLFALPLLFVGCKNNSDVSTSKRTDSPKIILEKTRCYRKCPIYTAKFFISDVIKVYPKANFTVSEKSEGKMKKGRISELLKVAKNIKFWQFDEVYDNKNLQDAPTTYITVIHKAKSKKIKVRANAPKELKNFIQLVEKEVKIMKWTTID